MGRRVTLPQEDVEIGSTVSPTVGALGVTSNTFDDVVLGEVVCEEDKLFEVLINE